MRPESLSSGTIGSILTAASFFPSSSRICGVAQQLLDAPVRPINSLQTMLLKQRLRYNYKQQRISSMAHEQVTWRLWPHHWGISLWHCRSHFFLVLGVKIVIPFLAWQLNHIFYDAAGDIVLFPHFWECSPSALLVCHHLLNLFTAHRNQYA